VTDTCGDRLDGPVFLVGAQRSGTTALSHAVTKAFSAQGHTFTINSRLPLLLQRWCTDRDIEGRHFRADEVQETLRTYSPGVYPGTWLERTAQALDRSAERIARGTCFEGGSIAEARAICHDSYLEGGYGQWGDKYNEYLLSLEYLDRLFPQARWIFVARRPDEVVLSMLRWSKQKSWHPQSIETCAEKWAAWNERWLSFRPTISSSRRVEVDYAALCEGQHADLSDLLGVDLAAYLATYKRQSCTHERISLTLHAQEVAAKLRQIGVLQAEESCGGTE
jgi:hypothetical protein